MDEASGCAGEKVKVMPPSAEAGCASIGTQVLEAKASLWRESWMAPLQAVLAPRLVVMLEGSAGSSKATESVGWKSTLVWLSGETCVTASGPAVVKPSEVALAPSGRPLSSRSAVVTSSCTKAPAGSAAAGVSTTLSPSTTALAMATQLLATNALVESWSAPVQALLALLTVALEAVRPRLKVTVTVVPGGTCVEPSGGAMLTTASAALVVKPCAWVNCCASAIPLASWAAVVTRN